MPEDLQAQPQFLLIVGLAIVLAMLVKASLERVRLPGLVGYLILGLGLRLIDDTWHVLTVEASWALELLAELGIACLLFRVGLESDPAGLRRHLPRALIVWIGNVVIAAVVGYLVARHLCGVAWLPSLFVATALSATSIGVTAAIWQNAGALHTAAGETFLDVAELDDLSAVALVTMLLAASPALLNGDGLSTAAGPLVATAGRLLLVGVGFGVACWLFARFAERRVTSLFAGLGHAPDPMLAVLGVGIMIAAIAGWLGFSVAIGAFFAGLVFSRDPVAVRDAASFDTIYDLFTPFFFIHIGVLLDPTAMLDSLAIGVPILLAAIVGKLVGVAVPLIGREPPAVVAVLAVSMVPRAEIALVVAELGKRLGPTAMPDAVYGALVLTTAGTCVLAPLVLRRLLDRGVESVAVLGESSASSRAVRGVRPAEDANDA